MRALIGVRRAPALAGSCPTTSNAAPHGDRRIGDVERRPVPAGGVKIRKSTTAPSTMRSIRLPSAPPRISASARAEQRSRPLRAQQHAITTDCDQRDGDEKAALPAGGAGEKAESRAGVVGQHQIEKAACTATRLAAAEPAADRDTWSAWSSDDHQRAPARTSARAWSRHAKRRASPAPYRLATQRPHSAGCAASAPTSAR